MLALLEAMRPHQWVKNLLVVAPWAFAHRELGDTLGSSWRALPTSLMAFAVFCLLSSSIYLLNDVVDRAADAQHPTKRNRPIPSGRLPVWVAVLVCIAGGAGAIAWSTQLGPPDRTVPFSTWPLAYLGLNLGYSFWWKRWVIVDCLSIALGFQIRVHAGAVVLGVESSPWILLCTFFFALFLAFCKRREEVERTDGRAATRHTLREYDVAFLDQVIAPLAALSILCYALYTVDKDSVAKHGENLKFTVPFVVFGVFRYLFLVHKRGEGADPSKLLFRDPPLVLSGLLWGGAVLAAIATRAAP
jgi:4-hydroxybenzoate polyprenyltransferase